MGPQIRPKTKCTAENVQGKEQNPCDQMDSNVIQNFRFIAFDKHKAFEVPAAIICTCCDSITDHHRRHPPRLSGVIHHCHAVHDSSIWTAALKLSWAPWDISPWQTSGMRRRVARHPAGPKGTGRVGRILELLSVYGKYMEISSKYLWYEHFLIWFDHCHTTYLTLIPFLKHVFLLNDSKTFQNSMNHHGAA